MLLSVIILSTLIVSPTLGQPPVKTEPGACSNPPLDEPWLLWSSIFRVLYTPNTYPIDQFQAHQKLTLMQRAQTSKRFRELVASTNRPAELEQFLKLDQDFKRQRLGLEGLDHEGITESILNSFAYHNFGCFPYNLTRFIQMAAFFKKYPVVYMIIDANIEAHYGNCWQRFSMGLIGIDRLLYKEEVDLFDGLTNNAKVDHILQKFVDKYATTVIDSQSENIRAKALRRYHIEEIAKLIWDDQPMIMFDASVISDPAYKTFLQGRFRYLARSRCERWALLFQAPNQVYRDFIMQPMRSRERVKTNSHFRLLSKRITLCNDIRSATFFDEVFQSIQAKYSPTREETSAEDRRSKSLRLN